MPLPLPPQHTQIFPSALLQCVTRLLLPPSPLQALPMVWRSCLQQTTPRLCAWQLHCVTPCVVCWAAVLAALLGAAQPPGASGCSSALQWRQLRALLLQLPATSLLLLRRGAN
jgi:hypothetical protein